MIPFPDLTGVAGFIVGDLANCPSNLDCPQSILRGFHSVPVWKRFAPSSHSRPMDEPDFEELSPENVAPIFVLTWLVLLITVFFWLRFLFGTLRSIPRRLWNVKEWYRLRYSVNDAQGLPNAVSNFPHIVSVGKTQLDGQWYHQLAVQGSTSVVGLMAISPPRETAGVVPEMAIAGSELVPIAKSKIKNMVLLYNDGHHVGVGFRVGPYLIVPRHVWNCSSHVYSVDGAKQVLTEDCTEVRSMNDVSDFLAVCLTANQWSGLGVASGKIAPACRNSRVYVVWFNPYRKVFERSSGLIHDAVHKGVQTYSFRHSCTTKPGMSGSIIVTPDFHTIVGMHTHAKSSAKSNYGMCVRSHLLQMDILPQPQWLKSLTDYAFGLTPERKARREGGYDQGEDELYREREDFLMHAADLEDQYHSRLGDRLTFNARRDRSNGEFEPADGAFWADMVEDDYEDENAESSLPLLPSPSFRPPPRKQADTGLKSSDTTSLSSSASKEVASFRSVVVQPNSRPEESQSLSPLIPESKSSFPAIGPNSLTSSGPECRIEIPSSMLYSTQQVAVQSPPERTLTVKRSRKKRGTKQKSESQSGDSPAQRQTTSQQSEPPSGFTSEASVSKETQDIPGVSRIAQMNSPSNQRVKKSSSLQSEGSVTLRFTQAEAKVINKFLECVNQGTSQ